MRQVEYAKAVLGMAMLAGVAAMAGTPPPPPGNGGGIKPPDAPPPGKIYFEDNVVIIGEGFVKPTADSGTVYIDLTKLAPVNPDVPDPAKKVQRVVSELSQVKAQIESETGALPPGLFDPASLLAVLADEELTAGRGVFDDPAFLHEEVGSGEAAAPDRTEQARSGGAAVKTEPGSPAPAPAARARAGAAVTPSYWQLPLQPAK